MLKLNLFYEQQQIQRDKDLDPIKLTIIAGILITLGILAWASFIYFRLAPLRAEVAANQAKLNVRKKEFSDLGAAIDLPKIQSTSDCLHDYQVNRILIAPQLDAIRSAIPTNCVIRHFYTMREVKDNDDKKTRNLRVDMYLEANAQAKDRVQLLQVRDNLFESFRQAKEFQGWIQQVPSLAGDSNLVNSVISVSSITKDPNTGKDAKPGDNTYRGVFEFKMPFVVKDGSKVFYQ